MEATQGRSRRVTQNTLVLYGAEVVSRLCSWALLAFLTRHWIDVGTYGQYAVAVNWVSIVAIFSDLGLNLLVVREVARQKEKALFYLRYTIFIRGVFSLVFWGVLIGISFILGYEPILKWGIALMGLRILLDSIAGGYAYLFQSHEMMGFYSLSNVISSAVRLAGIVIVVLLGGGVVEACGMWTVASGAALLVLVWKGSRLGWTPNFSQIHLHEVLMILRQSIPLAVFGSLQMLYYRVDSVILKSMTNNEIVGYYNLAAQVIFVVLAFSQIFSTAIFPTLSSVRDDSRVFGRMATRATKFLFLAGVPATVGGVLLARPIIVLISGVKYLPSVPLFMVLMFSVGAYFLSHVYVIALANFSIFRLNLQFVILFVLNAGLNFILIPLMGGIGASWSTVICEAFGLVLGFYLAAPYFEYFSFKTLFKPFLACLGASTLMGLGIWWDGRLYWLVLGPVVYAAGVWLFRGLEPDEWKSFFSILRRKKA